MAKCPRLLMAVLAGFVCVVGPAPCVAGAIVGQIDTFEDGTTQNWIVGLLGIPHPAPPSNVSSGGPAGVGDNYLLLTALGGAGPGSRLAAINIAQWAGDYLAAGITAIQMDLINFGPSDLQLRLLVADPAGGPATNVAFSTNPVFVPAGGGWTSAVFPILSTDLTAGLGSAAAALASVTEFRLFHSPTAVFPGPAVTIQIGVDNITALGGSAATVPEPATSLIFGWGGLALLCFRSRRTRYAGQPQ